MWFLQKTNLPCGIVIFHVVTIFSGGSVGRYDEKGETQQQSYSGISDVAWVTAQDKIEKN